MDGFLNLRDLHWCYIYHYQSDRQALKTVCIRYLRANDSYISVQSGTGTSYWKGATIIIIIIIIIILFLFSVITFTFQPN